MRCCLSSSIPDSSDMTFDFGEAAASAPQATQGLLRSLVVDVNSRFGRSKRAMKWRYLNQVSAQMMAGSEFSA